MLVGQHNARISNPDFGMADLPAGTAYPHHLFRPECDFVKGDRVAGAAQDQIRRHGVISFGDRPCCYSHIYLLRAVFEQTNTYTSLTVSAISQSTTAARASAFVAPSAAARANTASWRWALVPRARISRACDISATQPKWHASGSMSASNSSRSS